MPDTLPFLVAEFDGGDSPSAILTRDNPGATVDVMADNPILVAGRRAVPAAFLVKGIGTGVRKQYVGHLARLGCAPQVLRDDPFGARLVGRALVPIDVPPTSVGLTAILLFLGVLRNPWVHAEQGVFHLRARLADPERADETVRQVQRELERRGLDAQVAAQAIDRSDYSVWRELVQQTQGLGPAAGPAAGPSIL